MKTNKKLLIIILCVLSNVIYSQEHMKFKDIPIDGSINTFAQKLINIGYKMHKTMGDVIILQGNFVNKECDIYIVGSVKTKIVWRVLVYLPEISDWYSIKSNYFDLKKQFQYKYGEGKSFEFFSKPYYEGDGFEMQALGVEKCTYVTFFKTESGDISVDISKYKQISISYEDKINCELKNKEANDRIKSDI